MERGNYKQVGNKTLAQMNRDNRRVFGGVKDEELTPEIKNKLSQRVNVIRESLKKGHNESIEWQLEDELGKIQNILEGRLRYTGQV
jgi:hypothetical protein